MRIRIHLSLIIVLLSSLLTMAQAEIYRWVDPQGNVEYSDTPREGAEKVELPPPAVISMPKPEDVPQRATPAKKKADGPPYRTLEVLFPKPDSAFFSGSGDVAIQVNVEPPLRPGHRLQAVLDGQVKAFSEGDLILKGVFRGTHRLQINVVEDSRVIQSTAPITFTIHRPRVKQP